MRLLKKVNKGLLLTILVVAILSGYLFNLERERKSQKTEIQSACQAYIDFSNKYSMFEDKYKTIDKTISNIEYDKYINNMKLELFNIFINEDKLMENQLNILKLNLESQTVGNFVITGLNRKVVEFSSFVFDSNNVTVKINSYVDMVYLNKVSNTIDPKTGKYIGETNTNKDSLNVSDTISLQKVDGKWKVVYANLLIPTNDKKINYNNM